MTNLLQKYDTKLHSELWVDRWMDPSIKKIYRVYNCGVGITDSLFPFCLSLFSYFIFLFMFVRVYLNILLGSIASYN